MTRWGRGQILNFVGESSYAGGLIKFMGISPVLLIRENHYQCSELNQHVHFAHDEVTLIIVFGSDNQFIVRNKDGFANCKSTPPLATTTH